MIDVSYPIDKSEVLYMDGRDNFHLINRKSKFNDALCNITLSLRSKDNIQQVDVAKVVKDGVSICDNCIKVANSEYGESIKQCCLCNRINDVHPTDIREYTIPPAIQNDKAKVEKEICDVCASHISSVKAFMG